MDIHAKRILNEFYALLKFNKGIQRIDEKINTLLQEMQLETNLAIRAALINNESQFTGSVVANEIHGSSAIFTGFHRVSAEPERCNGVYLGFNNWDVFSEKVQKSIYQLLDDKGILF